MIQREQRSIAEAVAPPIGKFLLFASRPTWQSFGVEGAIIGASNGWKLGRRSSVASYAVGAAGFVAGGVGGWALSINAPLLFRGISNKQLLNGTTEPVIGRLKGHPFLYGFGILMGGFADWAIFPHGDSLHQFLGSLNSTQALVAFMVARLGWNFAENLIAGTGGVISRRIAFGISDIFEHPDQFAQH